MLGSAPDAGLQNEQRLFITESSRFHVGIGCNAIEVHFCGRSEQVAPGTLGDERECEIETRYGNVSAKFPEVEVLA